MPHLHDAERRRAVGTLLTIPYKAVPRTPSGLPALDGAEPHQQRFQAVLFTCIASSVRAPHPFEHPDYSSLASIACYLNRIVPHNDRVDIYTNTAARIASRMLPLLHRDLRISGIPGLRIDSFTGNRVKLRHLHTGARVDLVDSHGHASPRDMKRDFRGEAEWHEVVDHQPLWQQRHLTPAEKAYERYFQPGPTTALLSALLIRVIPLYWEHRITWSAAPHSDALETLNLVSQAPLRGAIDLLTTTEARIPGAIYQPWTKDTGVLSQATAQVLVRRHG